MGREKLSSKGLRACSRCPQTNPHPTKCNARGELEAGEDPTGLTPAALRARKPSLAMVGLMAILDPPREEAIEAVKVAHEAGITVKMITGGRSCVYGSLVCVLGRRRASRGDDHAWALSCVWGLGGGEGKMLGIVALAYPPPTHTLICT